MRNNSHIYIFIDWRHYPLMTMSVEQAGLYINNLIVWDKTSISLGGNFRSQHELIIFASRGPARELTNHKTGNVIQCKRVFNGEHPTEKPVELMKTLIGISCIDNCKILDPFLGSGSSRIAAHDMGFDFVGYEIDRDYFEAQEKRFANHIKQGNLFDPKEMY